MPGPSRQEYLDASAAVYDENPSNGVQDILLAPSELTPLTVTAGQPSSQLGVTSLEDLPNGFYAQAFEDASGNVLIAFEGSYPFDNSTPYDRGADTADVDVLNGKEPIALFNDAYNFVEQVEAEYGSHPIYVTGHSLGGAEAEYVASKLDFIEGGATFGAPGLPDYYSNPLGEGSGAFVDYVDYGDPVGNYASDITSVIPLVLPATGDHFGEVKHIGSVFDELPDTLSVAGLLYDADHFHILQNYASLLGNQPSIGIPSIQYTGVAYELEGLSQSTATPSSSTPNSSQPAITSQPIVAAFTNSVFYVANLFTPSESPTSSDLFPTTFTITFISGQGQIFVAGQSYRAGSPIPNVSLAEFDAGYFSAGTIPGVNEITVTAYDQDGTPSSPASTAIEVAAPNNPTQVNETNTTPPTIVPPTQTLVVGVSGAATMSADILNVTDSAGYSPSQLKYIITSTPTAGWLVINGSIVSSFTQADINNGLVQYQQDGAATSGDNFSYYVTDPNGDQTPINAVDIQISSPPTSTSPTLTTDSTLTVGQNLSAVIADSNLDVTDNDVTNRWQIVYTIANGPSHGEIIADGAVPVTYFTQQQLDLGLIQYRNTGNVSGQDSFTFTVSDGQGGTIGQSTFDINVIPKNSLSVVVGRPLYASPGVNETVATNIPGYVGLITSQMLSASDPGVDPSNIDYTVESLPADAYDILIGSWGAWSGSQPTFNPIREIIPNGQGGFYSGGVYGDYFTQAEVDAGEVFFLPDQYPINYGEASSLALSVSDNVGNVVSGITLPVVLEPPGLLTDGTYYQAGSTIPDVQLTASVGQTTVVGSGALTYISNQFPDSQKTWWVWYLPQYGTLDLDGVPLSVHSTFTQADIDTGSLTYAQNGSSVATDQFGLGAWDPNSPGNPQVIFRLDVTMTGDTGGQVLTGSVGAEVLYAGAGSNYFIGDGNTSVSYVDEPNSVSVNVAGGTVANGYGGTDTLNNIHSLVGSSFGNNTVTYNGTHTDFSYQQLSDGALQVSDLRAGSPDGIDIYQGFQQFDFTDGTYTPTQLLSPPDTSPPTLVHDGSIGVTVGETVIIPESELQFDDNVSTHAQEHYTVINGPSDGVLLKDGVPTTSFTQADIDDSLIAYQQNGAIVSSDTFTFQVADAAGNATAVQQLQFQVTRPEFPENSGNNDEWILSDGQWLASAGPGSHPSGSNVAGIGDWTGNGTEGILWFNPTTGDTDEWQLSNTQWAGSVDLGTHPGNYQISDVGDFNGDGIDDVLWTSASGGNVQTDIWQLSSSGQWAASVSPGSHPAGYTVAGTGDWTGNGTDGILWYNASNGDTDEWQLSNGQWAGSVDLGSHPGNFQISGIGDFNGDGIDDVLWTNINADGTVATDIWELNSSGQWMASVSPGNHPAGYSVVGVGDFTGNGTSDILWQNSSTGDVDEWLINNGQWAGSVDLGSHPGNFQISGTGNFTGGLTSDILWHNNS